MRSTFTGLAFAAACAQTALAWGNSGHQTVGYVAMEFLAPKALSFVQSSLGSTYNKSLGPAATWADTIKYTSGWTWSKALHYVDAEDTPLSGSCSVSQSRDCGDGDCILSAIANYTTRVAKTSLSATQRQQALMFLDHFLGDIGQPLHCEAYEVGGNDIDVTCDGDSTNLHSTWDTGLVEKNIDDNHSGSVTTYASDLIKKIKTGSYKSLTDDWLACSSTTETVSRRFFSRRPHNIEHDVRRALDMVERASDATITPLECPLVWAQESNAYDCSVVFSYKSGSDLCTGTYYTKAVTVIDLQLAKQGYRLAAWLNVLFDGDTNLP